MELNTEERDALSRVTRTLRDRFGAREVILYGSAARGQLDDESDIDLLVVLPRIDWEMQKEIIAVCFDAELLPRCRQSCFHSKGRGIPSTCTASTCGPGAVRRRKGIRTAQRKCQTWVHKHG